MRVVSVSVRDASASVVLPAWDVRKKVSISLDDVPVDIRALFAPGFRCHAHVNIGAETATALRFVDWETT